MRRFNTASKRTTWPRVTLALQVALALPFLESISSAQSAVRQDTLTIDQAVSEALEHNLALFAERYNLSVADARIITARLRPNPVLTLDADHIPWAGTTYNRINNAGPEEYAVRTDFIFERGRKRE